MARETTKKLSNAASVMGRKGGRRRMERISAPVRKALATYAAAVRWNNYRNKKQEEVTHHG